MTRATGILLFLVGLLAGGCQVRPAKPHRPPQPATEAVPTAAAPAVVAPTPEVSGAGAPEAPGNLAEWTNDAFSEPAPAAAPSPNGRVRVLTWDFGTVPPGTEVRHKFTIANDDTRSWTVKHVTPTCACTVGELTPPTLKPSASGSLEVTLRSGTKQALIAQNIVVEFKEPHTPVFSLAIQGEVSNSLSAVPPAVKFGRVTSGDTPTRSFEVRNSSGHDVAITRVESPEWARVTYQPVATKAGAHAPRQKWNVTVRADPARLRPGLHTAAIVVHTDAADLEPLKVPVGLYLNRPLEPIPANLTFEPLASGKTAKKTFLLEVAPDLQGVTERDLVLTHNFGEELAVEPPRKVAKHRFLVTAEFRPKRAPGAVKGELEIRAQGREVEPARVTIRGEVR